MLIVLNGKVGDRRVSALLLSVWACAAGAADRRQRSGRFHGLRRARKPLRRRAFLLKRKSPLIRTLRRESAVQFDGARLRRRATICNLARPNQHKHERWKKHLDIAHSDVPRSTGLLESAATFENENDMSPTATSPAWEELSCGCCLESELLRREPRRERWDRLVSIAAARRAQTRIGPNWTHSNPLQHSHAYTGPNHMHSRLHSATVSTHDNNGFA